MVVAAEFDVVLPAASRSIALMRHFLVHALDLCDAPADPGEAALVISELVTNALEHGQAHALSVALRIDDEHTTIAVSDESERPPEIRSPGPVMHHGQGLRIVESIAEEWGWSYQASGEKVVWAVLGAGSQMACVEA